MGLRFTIVFPSIMRKRYIRFCCVLIVCKKGLVFLVGRNKSNNKNLMNKFLFSSSLAIFFLTKYIYCYSRNKLIINFPWFWSQISLDIYFIFMKYIIYNFIDFFKKNFSPLPLAKTNFINLKLTNYGWILFSLWNSTWLFVFFGGKLRKIQPKSSSYVWDEQVSILSPELRELLPSAPQTLPAL